MATSRESRRYVFAYSRFAGAGIWLRQESLRYILASPGYAPGRIVVNLHGSKENSMLVKRIAAYTHLSSIVYELQRDSGRKLQLFLTPLHLTPPLGCSHWNSGENFGPQKTRIMGLPGTEDSLTTG